MIGRLLFMTFGAYLLAAFPACAQNSPSYHDSCGGDSCASKAYDLGYHDGYEGKSYTALPQLGACPSNAKIEAWAQDIVLRSYDVYCVSYASFKNPITRTGS